MPNLSAINSEFRKVAVFVMWTIFHAEFLGMFMIYLDIKFYVTSFSVSVVIALNPKLNLDY